MPLTDDDLDQIETWLRVAKSGSPTNAIQAAQKIVAMVPALVEEVRERREGPPPKAWFDIMGDPPSWVAADKAVLGTDVSVIQVRGRWKAVSGGRQCGKSASAREIVDKALHDLAVYGTAPAVFTSKDGTRTYFEPSEVDRFLKGDWDKVDDA